LKTHQAEIDQSAGNEQAQDEKPSKSLTIEQELNLINDSDEKQTKKSRSRRKTDGNTDIQGRSPKIEAGAAEGQKVCISIYFLGS
jgi:hypothetical protein